MRKQSFLQVLLCVVAVMAYGLNGAQAHTMTNAEGVTLSLPVCGVNGIGTLTIELDGPAQKADHSCCGPCMVPFAILAALLVFQATRELHAIQRPRAQFGFPLTLTPLWPGAPPTGPPSSLTF